MRLVTTIFALVSLLNLAWALNVGIITDVHLHLRYNPAVSHHDECTEGEGEPTYLFAPMGRYQCDCPSILIETMLKRFKEKFGKQDVIFLTGDFNAHHVAMRKETSENTYPLLLDTMAHVNHLLATYFPDTLVLPAFGNND